MKSVNKSRLQELAKERQRLKRCIEEIKTKERKILLSCQHTYDDGTNAWKPLFGSDCIAHTMACDVCNVYVKISAMDGYEWPK